MSRDLSRQSPSALSATLPIEFDKGLSLDIDRSRLFGGELSALYASGQPFPHIVIDEFLPGEMAREILRHFPSAKLPSDTLYELGYAGLHKRQVAPADCDEFTRNIFGFFNSAAMLQFLERLTGIAGLLPDPYFAGGGFHEIFRGGLLGIHADFRINQPLNLMRRINVLIYLNPDWNADWGGRLELWDRKTKGAVRAIEPIFNRCVVFNTDSKSFHGHPDPLDCPQDITRKSIALYYYTASEKIHEDTSSLGTLYKSRPSDTLKNKAEVTRLQAENYVIRDWLPPALFRGIKKLRKLRRLGLNR